MRIATCDIAGKKERLAGVCLVNRRNIWRRMEESPKNSANPGATSSSTYTPCSCSCINVNHFFSRDYA